MRALTALTLFVLACWLLAFGDLAAAVVCGIVGNVLAWGRN